MVVTSHYVRMRDGVRLAADIYLPKNLPSDVQLPAILVQSRYGGLSNRARG